MELISEPAVITAACAAGQRERLLTFLTRGQGGVRLYAKRQPRRPGPPAAFYEPLQGGELVFSRTREGGRGRLLAFRPQRVWPGIRGDLWRTLHTQAFLETLNASITEGCAQPELFALLVRFLDRLETETRPGRARAIATLRLLALSGFAPSLTACVGCQAAVPPGTAVRLSPDEGGVLCAACRETRREHTIAVSSAAHGFLARALTLPEGQSRRLRTNAAVEREASRVLDVFLESRTGFSPRCGTYIERLESS